MNDFKITGLGDGFLIGFTYFAKEDRLEAWEEEDWAELNIYLGIIKLTWRFFQYSVKILKIIFFDICHRISENTIGKHIIGIQRDMDGNEIIRRLKDIKQDVWNIEPKKANQKIDYLIDDIFMYKENSL